jgi:hypothetical protein
MFVLVLIGFLFLIYFDLVLTALIDSMVSSGGGSPVTLSLSLSHKDCIVEYFFQ